jgi:hypothetical protein
MVLRRADVVAQHAHLKWAELREEGSAASCRGDLGTQVAEVAAVLIGKRLEFRGSPLK